MKKTIERISVQAFTELVNSKKHPERHVNAELFVTLGPNVLIMRKGQQETYAIPDEAISMECAAKICPFIA